MFGIYIKETEEGNSKTTCNKTKLEMLKHIFILAFFWGGGDIC